MAKTLKFLSNSWNRTPCPASPAGRLSLKHPEMFTRDSRKLPVVQPQGALFAAP
ncbi:hypothetical protein CSIRO_1208 [Bradyrhizobiaceae bacterium SG-6C]|nr:hypothetical protein CSIRO_1208 [Bradyrhizobiaceae bacterium SG-6C]